MYVVSVNTTNNRYAATTSAFTTERVAGNLDGPAGSNGVYSLNVTGMFPTTSNSEHQLLPRRRLRRRSVTRA